MRHPFQGLAAALLVPALLTGCAIEAPQLLSGRAVWQDDHGRVELAINDMDRQRIHDYYHRHEKRLPPGLAKKRHLPPGHQKRLERHGKLPPGLVKRTLPDELERSLSPLPVGYVRIKVGGDVVLVETRTQVMADIVYGVDTASLASSDD